MSDLPSKLHSGSPNYDTMGTERPSCTLYDTLSNINTSDRKLQPGGKVSRDPSPRPAMTAKSERNRDGSHEEDWRRDREREKMRDKARCKDQNPQDRYERDRAPAQWPREGEREWRERERRQEDDRRRNTRPLSNVEKEDEREVERGMKKGDTFPRMRKNNGNHGRQITAMTEQDEERRERRQRDRPKRIQADDWEREIERYKVRERDEMRSRAKEERKNTERRPLDDEKSRQRERYPEFDASFQERRRKRDDSWDRKDRDTATKREKLRPDMRRPRLPSPHRQRDGEIYAERVERDKARKTDRQRDTRSEGDIDEREMRRERQRDRERDELQYHHSRSDGDSTGKRERDKQGYREKDRQRYRDRDREREVVPSRKREVEKDREKRYGEVHRRVAGEADRERERYKENMRDVKDDRRRYDRYKESRQGRGRETNKRELDHKRGDSSGRGAQSQSETAPRVPPRAQSSGEWSTAESDRDIDEYRSEEFANERRENEQKRIDRQDRDRGEMSAHRRMWLEPQRGKNSKDAFSDKDRHTEERNMEPQSEWGREQNKVKEEPDQCHLDQSSYREGQRGRNECSTEGVSVDGEELSDVWGETDKGGKERLSDSDGGIERSRWSEAEAENVTDIIDRSDREEECGSDYWARSESEGGSDTGWQQERDRMLSGEDGFVTVSSGVDEEDDREGDEEEFEDCQEFLDSAVLNNDPSPEPFKGDKEREEDWRTGKAEIDEDDQGREKQPKYVFCVIGQTLSREKSLPEVDPAKGAETDISNLKGYRHYGDDTRWEQEDGQIINDQDTESRSGCNNSREETEVDIELETGDGISHGMEHPYAEIGPINRDSQTEKLLMEWREKNKEEMERKREHCLQVPNNPYADVYSQEDFEQIQPILDRIDTGAMSPEEVEAIRIRLSRAWTMSEQPKRHSQAPHLKWAKNVVREILGNSEEQIVDETDVETQKDKQSNQFERITKNDVQQVEIIQKSDGQVPKLRVDEHDSDPELEEDESLEVEGLRGMGQRQADMHAEQFTAMHGDTSTHTHTDTLLDTDGKETDPSIPLESEKADIVVEVCEKAEDDDNIEKDSETENLRSKEEVEMYLSVSNTLYKPNSCPILSYETETDLLVPSRQDESQEVEDRMVESEEERQEEESEQGTAEEVGSMGEGEESEVDSTEVSEKKNKRGTLVSSCSFRDLGPEARIRRRGIRKTTERGNGEHVSVKEEEGVARDRRTRIFSTTEDEDDRSKSWGEVELRNVLDTIERRKRNSRFFNAAQLYQQYSEAAQNFEILRQARSDIVSASEDATPSPAPSPPLARRPLPRLPTVKHPHSLSNTGSICSVRSLPLPEPPKTERRASSPRLSISLSQSATLWRELPAVRNSSELGELTEDQRRLQEVRFEVVTSEASYCRSLDIVVEHFVKSKQLGALLGTQDRNWLFSRLADVRAISHSFLSKLEERMESNIMSFTVCDVIARNCQRFKMVYVPYLTNQSYQDATYQRLMNENPGFKMIVEKLERSPLCQRLPLRSFLVLPFQRITRLKLLVQNIVKRTSPGTTEGTQAIKALKHLEKLIQESNDSITQMKSIESLVSLSAKVDFECRTLPLISQSRRMVREGPVIELIDFSLKDTERNIYLHLFNDYLLISLQKEGGRFTVIDHSPVSDLRVENCRVKLHSLQKNLFRLHMSNKALLLRTDTLSDKLRWISALSRPHPEIDFSTAQEFPQMQCIRAFVAQQPDELSLEKADIILVHQESSDHWIEGTRLSDRHRGWVPESHLETISNSRVRQRNLSDALKLTTATAAV